VNVRLDSVTPSCRSAKLRASSRREELPGHQWRQLRILRGLSAASAATADTVTTITRRPFALAILSPLNRPREAR